MGYNKNSKRSIKKRRESHRKINKYQIGGSQDKIIAELVKNMDNVNRKIITIMHEQVENISKNINNIKALFFHPTAFFRKKDEKKKAKVIEDANKEILASIKRHDTLWGGSGSFIVLFAFLAMHISLTYLVDIKTGVELASPIYNSASPHFINEDNNSVINYIIRNRGNIKFIDSTSFFGHLTGITDPIPPSPIDIDKHPMRDPEFSVSDRYKNYLNLIIELYIRVEAEKQLTHAKKRLLRETAIKKRDDILKQMPRPTGKNDKHGNPLYTQYNYGNIFSIKKFSENPQEFHDLFDLKHYGWTETDQTLLLRQIAIKKHHDIINQMPLPTGEKDSLGNPLYKHHKFFDGNPFSIINFSENPQEFHNLFDLKHYGWTETDRHDLFRGDLLLKDYIDDLGYTDRIDD